MNEQLDTSRKAQLYYAKLSLDSFREYINFVEENLLKHHTLIHNDYKKIVRNLQEPGYDKALDEKYSEVSQILNEVELGFIQRFRYSVIIQAYAFLETELNNLCLNLYAIMEKDFKVSDLRGQSDLEKAKKYLQTIVSNDISKNKSWHFINDLRKLRNVIVHNDGIIMDTNTELQSLKKFSENNFRLRETGDCFIVRLDNTSFLIKCIDEIESFIFETVNWHIA